MINNFSMPRQIYDFVPINKMESFTIEERGRRIVDVCGIIKSADNETTTLTSKTTGKDMYKVCFTFLTNNMKYTVLYYIIYIPIRFRENLSSWIIQRHRFH